MTHAAQFWGLVYGGAVSLSNKSNPAVKKPDIRWALRIER